MDTKKIRAKLLDLAVRGKLVSQDPADEPASVLLGRIREERTKLVREKKAKAPKGGESVIYLASDGSRYEKRGGGEPVCIDGEIPFEVPEGWEWARLGSLFEFTNGTSRRSGKQGTEIPVLRLANLGMKAFDFRDLRNVLLSDSEISKYGLRFGDLLFIRVNGSKEKVGACYEVSEREPGMAFCDHLMRGRTCHTELSPFLARAVTAPSIKEAITARVICASGQNTISQGVLAGLLVPVPPLAEQRRIVAELDRLLALVDGVERDSADLGALRARARSKVLDLAVRGLLVPRDASDEPASALLARAADERRVLVKEGKAKAPKGGFSVIERRSDGAHYEKRGKGEPVRVEVPYDLPEGWAWARLGTISDYGMAGSTLASDIPDDAWVLDLEDIEKDTGAVLSHTTKLDRPPTSAKRPFVKGKLLYSKLRPYLNKVLIADADGFCTSEIMPIALYGDIVPEFIRLSLMSPYFLEYANRCAYGCKMPRLGTGDGQKALVPIPPLAEQRRIVNRVNQALDFLTNL